MHQPPKLTACAQDAFMAIDHNFAPPKWVYGSSAVARQAKPSKSKPPTTGKRRQTWTQRDAQRALRAIKAEKENRIVRITREGIELVPVGESAGGEPPDKTWDDLKKDNAEK
jgi:hypothetical protein